MFKSSWIETSVPYVRKYNGIEKKLTNKIFICKKCGYKSVVRSKFCPSCGKFMTNHDF